MNIRENKIFASFAASAKELVANPKQWIKDNPAKTLLTTSALASLYMPGIAAGMLLFGPSLLEGSRLEIRPKAYFATVLGGFVFAGALAFLGSHFENKALDIATGQAATKVLGGPTGSTATETQPFHSFFRSWFSQQGSVSVDASVICYNANQTSAVLGAKKQGEKSFDLQQYTRPTPQGQWSLEKKASESFVPSCGN